MITNPLRPLRQVTAEGGAGLRFTFYNLSAMTEICNYEDSTYKTDFWQRGGREYEDLAERRALKKLLPPTGQRLVDLGTGFGRLADLYTGYDQVLLLDYAKSQLRQAQTHLGNEPRFTYVAGDLYDLPLADNAFDTAITVRTLHHIRDIPSALTQIARIIRPGGTYVLEYANKRHLKAILRFLLRRQSENPFSPEPYEFVELHLDFHPAWMETRLEEAGFAIEKRLAVSHFRWPPLKRLLPPHILATLDGWLQEPAALWNLSPSLFLRAQTQKQGNMAQAKSLFRCLHCHDTDLVETREALTCRTCGQTWPIDDGIYDFRSPTR